MTAHPWLKPCPTCNRKHCGWHDRHGLCDAPFPDTAEAVIAEAEAVLFPMADARAQWWSGFRAGAASALVGAVVGSAGMGALYGLALWRLL